MTTTYTIQQRKKAQGIMTWYLRTCTDGEQKFESLHTTKKGEAMAILNRLKLKAAMPDVKMPADKPIQEMVHEWLAQVKVEFLHAENNTYETYRYRINNWAKWCSSQGLLLNSDFNAAAAYRYVEHISEKLAPKTISEIVKLVKKCLAWNVDTFGITDHHPFKSVKTPKLKNGRVEFWTSDEVTRILENAPSAAYRALWALMAYAGLRFAEARKLSVSNVRERTIFVVNGKGAKDAEIPISEKLWALIEPFTMKNDGWLIPAKDVPVRSDKAIIALKVAVGIAKAGGSEISHHKLRHSFASELLRKGTNPKTVQELMRHSSIDTLFKHYAHVLREDLAKAVETI